MRICMIGTGYAGLVTGACFAEIGHEVICIDKDPGKIDRFLGGEVSIFEPGLSELIVSNRRAGRLHFAADVSDAARRNTGIIVESRSEQARLMLAELYRPLTRQGKPLVVTSTVETAELIKYAANAFLATKISFVNELSQLCEKLGADIEELTLGTGLDKRIGDKFLKAGPGYGGSCFPKDTVALIKTANDFQCPVEIVETVVRVNDRHKNYMFNKIRSALDGAVAGKTIAILGLAFKANTDDVRGAPALTIVPALLREGAILSAYDPIAADNARELLSGSNIRYVTSIADALKGADAAVLLTEWDEFRNADWSGLAKTMASPLLIDLRSIFTLQEVASLELNHVSLGRVPVTSIQ